MEFIESWGGWKPSSEIYSEKSFGEDYVKSIIGLTALRF